MQTEKELIRMMAEYRTSLMRMAYLYLGDMALAEDAVQETFIKAYKQLAHFRFESSEKTWLMRIAINHCKDMHRTAWMKRRKQTVALEDAPEQGETDHYRDDTVINAVMGLPPKDKQVILLRYYQEMKVDEVAKALNISHAGAMSRLTRAKKRLYGELEGWYFDEE